MTAKPHDFRKPAALPPALRAALGTWTSQVCSQASRLWGNQLPFALGMEPCGVEIVTAGQITERLPDTAMRFRSSVSSSPDISLLVISRPLLVAVLGGMLGSLPESADLDIELTPVELEMAEFVAEQFFLAPLQQAWPLSDKLLLATPRREGLLTDPLYLSTSLLLVVQFRVKGEFGEFDWWWMLPRGGWLASLSGDVAPAPPPREAREAVIRELPVRLTVQLGAARLSLLHLAAMQVGDVLMLDQPIDQPLSAVLGGQKKFHVWPGACGTRQAVSIQAPIES